MSGSTISIAGQSTTHVIFTGTDPSVSSGGIGIVMKGYFSAMEAAELSFESIPTYHPTAPGGKSLLWLRALPKILRAIRKARASGKRPILYSHAGAGVSLFRESYLLLVSRLIGVKTIMQIHACQVEGYLNSSFKRFLFKMALWPANVVCLLTPWWMARLREAGIRLPLTVIPNALLPNLQKVAEHENKSLITNQSKVARLLTVLTMTRLVAGKGVDVVVRAMVGLPPWIKLIVAGDGNERSQLNAIVRELRLEERVHFAGWVSGDEKSRLLEKADIFCLPSTHDAFPICLMEAMAYGVPVVGVKWGGIPDMVADGRVGILVDKPDPQQIAVAIERLADEDVRQKMSVEAKRWVLKISSREVVSNKLKELFTSVLQG